MHDFFCQILFKLSVLKFNHKKWIKQIYFLSTGFRRNCDSFKTGLNLNITIIHQLNIAKLSLLQKLKARLAKWYFALYYPELILFVLKHSESYEQQVDFRTMYSLINKSCNIANPITMYDWSKF